MKQIEHVKPAVIEVTGNKVVMPKPVYKSLVETVNALVDTVNLLATNQLQTDERLIEIKLSVQALASSIRSL